MSRADHCVHNDIIRKITYAVRQGGVEVSGKKNDLGEVVIYRTKDSKTALDVRLVGDTVWLSQKQMGDLFDKNVRTISEHIRNVFKEKELDKDNSGQTTVYECLNGKRNHFLFR